MRIRLILFFFITIIFQTQAQTDSLPMSEGEAVVAKEAESTENVFTFVHVMPTIKSTQYKTLDAYIRANLIFPADAKAAHVTGIVYVQYIVETDGSVSDVHVINGRGLHPSCDKASVDVISKSTWNPGMQNGQVTRVKMVSKVIFN